MTVRNEEAYLEACLRSIISQTFQNWELIVIDDHSEDDTPKILEHFSRSDTRIKWSKNEGTGIISALSQAQNQSKGEILTRMDGDDLMPPDKLEILYGTLMNSPDHTMVTGKVCYVSECTVSEGYRSYEEWLNQRVNNNDFNEWIYRECVVASPNWMCFRRDLEQIGSFVGLTYPEDYDLVLKWHAQGFHFKGINELTHLWREHPERTSRNSSVYDQTSFYQLKIPYLVRAFQEKGFIVFGKGQKAKLAAQLLSELNKIPLKIDNPEDFDIKGKLQFESQKDHVLLLAIFPQLEERIDLEIFLQENGFTIGENCFYI